MLCRYINLAGATARRASLEASFGATAGSWRLERFEAIPAAIADQTAGQLRPAEKGCFLSHREALRASLAEPGPVLLVEDDVAFWPQALETLERAMTAPAWDIIQTNVAVADANGMLQLARLRREFEARRDWRLIDLARTSFASAAAYLVNGASKAKLLALLDEQAVLEQPYDLLLRDLVHAGRLQARLLFPFVTTFADVAAVSQIQPGEDAAIERVSAAFRRLMYVGRDLEACRRETEEISAQLADDEGRAVGAIFAAFASPRLRMK